MPDAVSGMGLMGELDRLMFFRRPCSTSPRLGHPLVEAPAPRRRRAPAAGRGSRRPPLWWEPRVLSSQQEHPSPPRCRVPEVRWDLTCQRREVKGSCLAASTSPGLMACLLAVLPAPLSPSPWLHCGGAHQGATLQYSRALRAPHPLQQPHTQVQGGCPSHQGHA